MIRLLKMRPIFPGERGKSFSNHQRINETVEEMM
jgi:hypothetical protein